MSPSTTNLSNVFLRRASGSGSGQNISIPADVYSKMDSMADQASMAGSLLQGGLARAIVSTGLFGVFVTCSVISVHLIIRKRRMPTPRLVLLPTIAILFACTTMYWAIDLSYTLRDCSTLVFNAQHTSSTLDCIGSNGQDDLSACVEADAISASDDFTLKFCAGTAALTINIVLGDAIVWWRACAIWQNRKPIRIVCVVFLLATLAMGVVSTVHSCNRNTTVVESFGIPMNGPVTEARIIAAGFLFEGDIFGMAASALSLATNLVATSLIGYKAWEHKRLIRKHLKSFSGRSQVERILTLFVESGAVYCIVWIFTVAYQIMSPKYLSPSAYNVRAMTRSDLDALSFVMGFENFVEGALITVIAIYPILIIILVSLDKSHCDGGLLNYDGSRDGSPAVVNTLVFRRSDGTADITTTIQRFSAAISVETGSHVEIKSKP